MVNRVTLVGNVGKDPEVRYTPSGTAVASFSLATSEKYKDSDGQKQEKTEWHNIIAWRQLAEICGKFLHKGKQVYIEGKIQTRSYDDRDGNKKYITEIVADKMQMLGNKDDGQGQERPANNQQSTSSRPANNQQAPRQNTQGGGGINEPMFSPDDEIPFAHPHCYRETIF